jgi:hypothetical protein
VIHVTDKKSNVTDNSRVPAVLLGIEVTSAPTLDWTVVLQLVIKM